MIFNQCVIHTDFWRQRFGRFPIWMASIDLITKDCKKENSGDNFTTIALHYKTVRSSWNFKYTALNMECRKTSAYYLDKLMLCEKKSGVYDVIIQFKKWRRKYVYIINLPSPSPKKPFNMFNVKRIIGNYVKLAMISEDDYR